MQQSAVSRPWHILVNIIGGSAVLTCEQRARVYRAGGLHLDTIDIRPGCFFLSPAIRIGAGSMVNRGCYFEADAPITIGRDCFLAMDVLIGTWTHDSGGPQCRAGDVRRLPVTIGDGCWIGARATILPGVTIGQGCVIGAGAVVTKACEPHGMYAGVPARRVRDLGVDGPVDPIGHRYGSSRGGELQPVGAVPRVH